MTPPDPPQPMAPGPTQTEALKRYDLRTNYRAGSSIEEMERDDDGKWIRYEDVASALLAAEQRQRELHAATTWACDQMRAQASRALAGDGASRGPHKAFARFVLDEVETLEQAWRPISKS